MGGGGMGGGMGGGGMGGGGMGGGGMGGGGMGGGGTGGGMGGGGMGGGGMGAGDMGGGGMGGGGRLTSTDGGRAYEWRALIPTSARDAWTLVADCAGLSGTDAAINVTTRTKGEFALQFGTATDDAGRSTSYLVPHDASAAALEAALENLTSVGDVVVTRRRLSEYDSAGHKWNVTFTMLGAPTHAGTVELLTVAKASRLEGTRPVAARDEVVAGYGASVELELSANGLFEYHKPLLSGAVAPTFDLLGGGRESTHGGGGASAGQRGHAPKIVLACDASACGNNAPGGGWLALPNRVGGQHSCIVARSRPMDDIATDELSRHAHGFVILEVFSATVSDCATGSAANALVPVLPENTSPVEHCAMSVHRTNHQTYGLDRHDAGAPERRAGSFVYWCCVAAARELFVFAICGLVALAAARGRRHAAERHCYAPTTSHHRPMRVFLAFVLLCNLTVATTTVTSFTALQSANVDGANIDVTNDVTFTDYITISGTVAMTSTTGATLSGGGSTRIVLREWRRADADIAHAARRLCAYGHAERLVAAGGWSRWRENKDIAR